MERTAPVVVAADQLRLARVIENLVGNALKHGAGGEVVVRVESRDGEATVSVIDRGAGVNQADLPHMFE